MMRMMWRRRRRENGEKAVEHHMKRFVSKGRGVTMDFHEVGEVHLGMGTASKVQTLEAMIVLSGILSPSAQNMFRTNTSIDAWGQKA